MATVSFSVAWYLWAWAGSSWRTDHYHRGKRRGCSVRSFVAPAAGLDLNLKCIPTGLDSCF